MSVLYIMSNGTPEENLKQIFRIFDLNNDGTLSPEEMGKLVKDLSKMFPKKDNPNAMSHEDLAHKALKEMDADSFLRGNAEILGTVLE